MRKLAVAAVAVALSILGGLGLVVSRQTTQQAALPAGPIRAAFYYPWYPSTWGNPPQTDYTPSLGYYSTDLTTVKKHIAWMQYAKIQAGIASWWGQGTVTDKNIPTLLSAAAGTNFQWSLYYEQEAANDPTVTQLQSDLSYIISNYANNPNYLHVNGKPVIFVYAGANDGCGMAQRWVTANAGRFYLDLKVFSGYRTCTSQPDSWHQYGPDTPAHSVGDSYTISPGFNKWNEPARLPRQMSRFKANVRDMVASTQPWDLITTFNEWGEGTSIEPSTTWHKNYLNALATDGGTISPTPTTPPPTTTTSTTTPPTSPPPSSLLVAAAGDLCGDCKGTSDLVIANHPDLVLTLGDNAYPSGSASDFSSRYAPNWGRFKSITKPSPGNHDYMQSNASAYRNYFGLPASGVLYSAFNDGNWHFVQLDTERMDSTQVSWAANNLATDNHTCDLAFGHTPRWSSGATHGSSTNQDAIWKTLTAAGVDIVLMGHDHEYERFLINGTREFVVGTGGGSLYHFGTIIAGSEKHIEGQFGVLFLTLNQDSYSWQFKNTAGTVLDSGSAPCH